MAQIRVLSEETINKIAAGEVIENPASVVKELVENSIDAESKTISIEIKAGGFQLIKISDDGKGMSRDDAILCFERHATSKIQNIDDLSSLDSMGFRGEALASIAAVSRVTLTTSAQDGEGTLVEIEGGKIQQVAVAPRQRGTTFEIRSLFYNVPARKKFQKSPSSSAADVHKTILSLALSHPEVGFKLISNEELILETPSNQPKLERVEAVFKGSFLSKHLMTEADERGYKLEAFFGLPSDHKSNRTGQYLFVNRRPVFSSQISYAVKEGYGQRLAEDRFPVFVLHLQVPPQLIDVNVHPQKREVRFQEADFIHAWIKQQLQEILQSPASPAKTPIFETRSNPIASWDAPLQLREAEPGEPMFVKDEVVIGLFQHYLLLDASSVEGYEPGIIWVDLQKVQENQVCQSLMQEDSVASQGLLLPVSMELTPLESQLFEHQQTQLVRCGFSAQASGKQTILIDAIPPFLEQEDIVDTVHLILQSEDPFSQLAGQVAHFALRRKKRFMLQEALSLWRKCRCKEGIMYMGQATIEKLFKSN